MKLHCAESYLCSLTIKAVFTFIWWWRKVSQRSLTIPLSGTGLRAWFVISKIVWKPILVQFSRLQKWTYTEIGLNSVVRNICRLVQLGWSPTNSEFLMKERVDILPRYLNLSCEKNIRHKLLFKVEQFTYILKRV